MKYISISLVFVLGFVLGRWTSPKDRAESVPTATASATGAAQSFDSSESKTVPQSHPDKSLSNQSKSINKQNEENKSLTRTDDKAREKQLRKLFDLLMEARRKDNIEEQNRLFAEMENLEPKHEKVFQAKATFLQDDDDWDGAHKVLEECVAAIPNSVFCLRRLANIRSSTIDDKIRFGSECLQVSKNDPSCLVDVAIALKAKGELTKAKDYFEQALKVPLGSEGYNREYILYHYGFALESLNLDQKAREAFIEACRLRMKPACEKLKI